jgi:hypothetical protein
MTRDRGHAIQRPSTPLSIALVLALTGMFLAVLPAPAAFADELPVDFEIQRACQEGEVPEAPFNDTTEPHEVAIECLYWYGLAFGVSDEEFQGERAVNRGEAASFTVRLLQRINGFELPEPEEDAFPDIRDTNPHKDNIEQLAGFDPAILRGFNDGTFRPTRSIQRDQFASVIDRTIDAIAEQLETFGELPDGDEGRFDDVPAENVHSQAVERLADAGLVLGRDENTYAPGGTLTRGQSASVFARLLGGLVYIGAVDRPAEAPAGNVSGLVSDVTNANPNEPGERLAGMTLEIRGDGARDLVTDDTGEYGVELPPGEYTFTIEGGGFVPYQQFVEIEDGDDLTVDFRMYRSAQPPAEEDVVGPSEATPANVEIRDNFWIIPLIIDGEEVTVQRAEQIILTRPDGVVLRLGPAGANRSWWNHDGDFTSNRGCDQQGDHILYFEFRNDPGGVPDGWHTLTATFDDNGTLIGVNDTECAAGECVPVPEDD